MGEKEILITFIVPIYKVDYEQLRRCVESIVNQKNATSNYEIILVDDGSPDDCGKICDEYANRYDNVRVFHQENQGLSVVRNNGVKKAEGTWVAFVDGDDWIEPDFVKFAEDRVATSNSDIDIFIWDGFAERPTGSQPIEFMDSDDCTSREFTGDEKEVLIDRIMPRYVKKSDIDRCTDIGITWGRIYRKTLLTENNIENIPGLRVMQDSIFNLWAFEYARAIQYQFKPLYHYSMYDESISKKQDENSANVMKELYRHFARYIMKCHNTEEYWQRLYVRTVRLLVKCLAKDYANPNNKDTLRKRATKMRRDLSAKEFQTALQKCDSQGQELRFKAILFLLKHKLYMLSILASKTFGMRRRLKNKVS